MTHQPKPTPDAPCPRARQDGSRAHDYRAQGVLVPANGMYGPGRVDWLVICSRCGHWYTP